MHKVQATTAMNQALTQKSTTIGMRLVVGRLRNWLHAGCPEARLPLDTLIRQIRKYPHLHTSFLAGYQVLDDTPGLNHGCHNSESVLNEVNDL